MIDNHSWPNLNTATATIIEIAPIAEETFNPASHAGLASVKIDNANSNRIALKTILFPGYLSVAQCWFCRFKVPECLTNIINVNVVFWVDAVGI